MSGGGSYSEAVSTKAAFLLADGQLGPQNGAVCPGELYVSWESVELAGCGPHASTRAFPDEENDNHRVASESGWSSKIVASSLVSFVAPSPHLVLCKRGI